MNVLGSYLQTVWGDGDVRVPAQYFAAEPGLGICRTFTGTQSNFTIAQAGAAVAKFGSGGTTFAGTVTAPAFVGTGSIVDSKYVVATGNASLTVPSFVWAENTSSGLSSDGTGNLGMVYQGNNLATFSLTGLTMLSGAMIYSASSSNTTHPGFAFSDGLQTGIYEIKSPTNGVGITVDGGSVATFATTGCTINSLSSLTVTGTSSMAGVTSSGTVKLSDGSVSAPALTFSSETNTGLSRTFANEIDVSLGGTLYASFTPAQTSFLTPATLVSDMACARILAAGTLPIRIDGVNVADFNANGLLQLPQTQLFTGAAAPSAGNTNYALTFGTASSPAISTSLLTRTVDTVNGDTWTVVQAGFYLFRYNPVAFVTAGTVYTGISRNVAGTVQPTAWTQAQEIGFYNVINPSDIPKVSTWTCYLVAGDVIRCVLAATTLTSVTGTWLEISYLKGTATSL